MSLNHSDAYVNAVLDLFEQIVGLNPYFEIRTGPKPANTAAADSGTVVSTVQLPADWLLGAAGRSKAMSGTWSDNAADATGIAAHFRLKSSGGVVHQQGTVGLAGSGADMILDNVNFQQGQQFSITSYTLLGFA